MTIKIHDDILQGSPEWMELRRGVLTASEMKLIITPTLKVASNEKEKTHLFELLAQRITGYVEPSYIGDDMLRGQSDELEAVMLYAKHYAPIRNVGFITNDSFGFTIGYSPDALIGDDGLLECKSRKQKLQMQTIIDYENNATIPIEHMLQLQTGLLVSGRKWIDFVSYCGGMPMLTARVHPIEHIQAAIIDAATQFEARLKVAEASYWKALAGPTRLIPTERKIVQEMF